MPIAFITYSFAYLDRSNYSVGAAGGLQDALGITSGQTGLLGGLFFIGYFIFQVPAARFAERRSVKTLMFWSLILWGILAALQGVVPWFWALLVIRFLLGVVEAAVLPAMLVFLAHWFSASERGRTNTFLILGNPVTLLWMSVASGYLIAATSYQWMFIIEGLPAIVWAFIFRAVTADRPADADWLNEGERKFIEKKLADEQAALPEPLGLRQVLMSRNVIILAIQYALWSVGVYGFVFWLPTIIESASQQGIGLTGLLSATPYAAAVVLMITASFFSDRLGHRKRFVWPFLFVATAALYASYLIGPGNFVLSYVLLIVAGAAMYAPYGPYFAFIPEFLPAASAAPAIGAVNAFGALGGFAGAYVVGLLGGGTKSGAAFLFMAACLLASAVLMFFVKPIHADAANTAGGNPTGGQKTTHDESRKSEHFTPESFVTVLIITSKRGSAPETDSQLGAWTGNSWTWLSCGIGPHPGSASTGVWFRERFPNLPDRGTRQDTPRAARRCWPTRQRLVL